MAEKSVTIKCATPRCIEAIEKWGANYHDVYMLTSAPAHMPDATAMCERCGGYTNGEEWKHACKDCGKSVEPGELVALFVPHKCRDCLKKLVDSERAAGKVCRRCHNTFSQCCC